MREIVKEVADARDVFTILSHNCALAKQQIIEVLSKTLQVIAWYFWNIVKLEV